MRKKGDLDFLNLRRSINKCLLIFLFLQNISALLTQQSVSPYSPTKNTVGFLCKSNVFVFQSLMVNVFTKPSGAVTWQAIQRRVVGWQ